MPGGREHRQRRRPAKPEVSSSCGRENFVASPIPTAGRPLLGLGGFNNGVVLSFRYSKDPKASQHGPGIRSSSSDGQLRRGRTAKSFGARHHTDRAALLLPGRRRIPAVGSGNGRAAHSWKLARGANGTIIGGGAGVLCVDLSTVAEGRNVRQDVPLFRRSGRSLTKYEAEKKDPDCGSPASGPPLQKAGPEGDLDQG